MSVRSLVISDLHADSTGHFSRTLPNGLPSRFASLLDVLRQVERQIEEHQPSDLLIGGDLTNRRHFITFGIYNPLYRAVERLVRMVKRTVIIVGNHDWERDGEHSLTPFGNLPNVILCDQPTSLALSDGTPLRALPYLNDPLAMAESVEQSSSEFVVLAHYAATGAILESGWWLDSPVKLGELDRFPQVIFGHVHKPSEQLNGKVCYVGAPLPLDFGDVGPRGSVLFRDGGFQRLPLSAPQFVTATWPRIPSPPAWGGYARILGVPAKHAAEAQEVAESMGWLGVAVHREAALPEMRAAIAAGLVVDRATLEALVLKKAPELDETQRAVVVDAGEALLLEARK